MQTINISTLKATLSAAVKKVRAGNILTITDRDVPVALLTPYPDETARMAAMPPRRRLTTLHSKLKIRQDPVLALLEDRGHR